MCTCLTYENGDFYFGRNLDLEQSFDEQLVITPRNFRLYFRKEKNLDHHYAMAGMASGAGTKCADQAFPLYAEAVNEKGLCMAGLNFPGNACYSSEDVCGGKRIASFELIPWVLGQCADTDQAIKRLYSVVVTDAAFRQSLPPAPLHWMVADRDRCYVVEYVKEGMQIYDNKFGVLTNNPPFEYHCMNLSNYLHLSSSAPVTHFFGPGGLIKSGEPVSESEEKKDNLKLPEMKPYSQGMGAFGLPGDASSASRFVRAAFLKWNSVSEKKETSNVSQVFHILDGVAMVRGTVITPEGKYDMTRYSCCINADQGIYYYKTYENSSVKCVRLKDYNLDGKSLIICIRL